jgi:hypothetical protein
MTNLDKSETSTQFGIRLEEEHVTICKGSNFFLHTNNRSNFSFQSSPSKMPISVYDKPHQFEVVPDTAESPTRSVSRITEDEQVKTNEAKSFVEVEELDNHNDTLINIRSVLNTNRSDLADPVPEDKSMVTNTSSKDIVY